MFLVKNVFLFAQCCKQCRGWGTLVLQIKCYQNCRFSYTSPCVWSCFFVCYDFLNALYNYCKWVNLFFDFIYTCHRALISLCTAGKISLLKLCWITRFYSNLIEHNKIFIYTFLLVEYICDEIKKKSMNFGWKNHFDNLRPKK